MFSVMTSLSSVETPVDRRRFVFSSVFCSLLGFISDDYSGRLLLRRRIRHLPLHMDMYLYISMYIQAEYRRFGVFNFLVLITVPVISFLL